MMFQSLYRFLFGTLRGRLIVGVAAVHAVMMALFIADLTMRQRAMLLDRQAEQATALSQALATSAAGWIAADDIAGMQELVDVQRRYPELLFAMLTDAQGRVLADSDHSRQGLYLLDLPRETRQSVFSRTAALVDVATPAVIGGRQVGWARVGIGQRVAGEKLARITISGMMYALAAIVVGSVIAWQMGRRITGRLYAVQETINRVRAGDRLARSSITGSDEAAMMAHEFNAMLDAVAERDAELRAGEEKYRELIQKIQAAVVVHGADARIRTSNLQAQRLLGLSEAQLAGKSAIDPDWHFARDDGTAMSPEEYPVSRVMATREPLRDLVMSIHRPADGDIWALVNADPVMGEQGEIEEVIVTFFDISDRKRYEETLHRLNRELLAISNCNQVLIRAEDEQTLLGDICRIICDEAGYHMAWAGYPENDDARTVRAIAWAGGEDGYLAVAGITWADTERGRGPSGIAIRTGESACIQDFATAPHVAPWRDAALQRGYRSSIALPLKDESAVTFGVLNIYSAEPNAFTPDEIRLLEELAADLAFGIIVLRTRDARKQAGRDVALMNFALDNVREAAFLIDEQARFNYVNEESCRVLGYTREELLGMGVADVDPDFPMERWPAHWTELAAKRAMTFEGRHRTKDGRVLPVEINANYIEYDGQSYNLALVRDITERKQAEEALLMLNEELDQRVRERTSELEEKNRELERANKLFVGRELRMIELKEQIKELEGKTKE